MKKKVWMTGVLSGAAILGLTLVPAGRTEAGTIPAGFSVEGLALEGMTAEEAMQEIQEYVDSMAEQQITLKIGDGEVSTTASQLGFSWTNREEIEEAAEQYAGGNILRRYLNIKSLEKEPVQFSVEETVGEEAVKEFVTVQCAAFAQPAQDAVITRENGVFQVSQSQPGIEIDAAATTDALNEAVKNGLESPITVEATVTETQPVRTTEMLSQIQDVLGTFSTNFSTGNTSRSKNLRNGASKVNGCVLMPGEEFSAYVFLTPFTVENGYASAASYANGQVVDTVGGGACQLCTTLYNAALLSEMEITQRQNHSMIVTYVKPSQDAAIAGTVKDLKFKNPYEFPVYIEGGVEGGTLTFTIYGKETRPANREIKFVSETLGTVSPGEPITKVDPSLPPGARVQEQSSHTGLQSRLWKYVYVDGVETEKELLHTDSYMASKAIYRVGPALPAVVPEQQVTPETVPSVPETQPAGPASDGPASEIVQQPAAETTAPAPVQGPAVPAP